MRKIKKIGFVMCSIILIVIIGYNVANVILLNNVNNILVNTPDLSNVSDGTYFGEYTIGPVHVEIEVAVENHKIINVNILEHDNGLGSSAESIPNQIVERQTLEIDAVSGATVSSKCILKAVEDAIMLQGTSK